MARKLRLQYPGAMYHVINRGNYRAEIFGSAGAKQAFLKCLGEACEAAGWWVHGYVLMRNHYHLALETPKGNLVEGMQWLQSTYANRFNRLRKEHGHVFQGRYRAIIVQDEGRLGAVAHYIHLNPIRAKLVCCEQAAAYAWSSLAVLESPDKRPSWLSFASALSTAGQLPDSPAGRRAYLQYLAWLDGDEQAQEAFGFDTMCSGWAFGSTEFKQGLMETHKIELADRVLRETEAVEVSQLAWGKALDACLRGLRRSREQALKEKKSSDWKVAIAAHLRATTTVKNPWLAQELHMGEPDGVSRYVSELRQGQRPFAAKLLARIADVRV